MSESIYDFSFEPLLGGDPVSLSQFRGKVLLIVNVASKCGFAYTYGGMQALYQKYKDRGFVVIGFPTGDFGNLELESSEQISQFCQNHYRVTFPMSQRIHVRGENAHPFYRYAAEQRGFWAKPRWNFHKYLVDRNGKVVDFYTPIRAPLSKGMIRKIENLLALEDVENKTTP